MIRLLPLGDGRNDNAGTGAGVVVAPGAVAYLRILAAQDITLPPWLPIRMPSASAYSL